ncbi:MAG: hypothetical protein RBU37_00275 [Myxococcota bacterium]|nr:hypothetical protein [Myxococcota bacterium]
MPEKPNLHRLAESRSLALHRELVARLRAQPSLLQKASARVAEWLKTGAVHPEYARAWARLLSGPAEELFAVLVDPGEQARALRQCTPFAGIVEPRERWRIWRQARKAFDEESAP